MKRTADNMIEEYNFFKNKFSDIGKRWSKENFDSEIFHEIVWDMTNDIDFSSLGNIFNQALLLEEQNIRSLQHNSTFSDFHFQIYNDQRFYVEILNWWGGHVNAHDHDFSAVQFQLKGNAVNIEYDFEEEERHGAIFLGKRKIRSINKWKEGSRSRVRFGSVDPHAVYHIDNPSTSMLIRTLPTPRAGYQKNFFSRCAAHYYVATSPQRKKLTALNLLALKSNKEFRELLFYFLKAQSLSENMFMISKVIWHLIKDENKDILEWYSCKGKAEELIVFSVLNQFASDRIVEFSHKLDNEKAPLKEKLFIIASSCKDFDEEVIRKYLNTSYIQFDCNDFFEISESEAVNEHIKLLGY